MEPTSSRRNPSETLLISGRQCGRRGALSWRRRASPARLPSFCALSITASRPAGREWWSSPSGSPCWRESMRWCTRASPSRKRWRLRNPSGPWFPNRRNARRDKLVQEGMRRILAALCLFAVSALAANVRLYLKDGTYQMVREYAVQQDRVHYYSIERSDWEDIPLDLVDLKRTEREIADRQATVEQESKVVAAEEKVEHEQQREASKIPQDPGVYQLTDTKELRILKAAESKVHSDKRRAVLKAMSPIPMVTGKATVEVDGSHASYNVDNDAPEFYIQLSAEEQFGIIRLVPKDNIRIAEKLTIIPVTKDVMEEPEQVEIFRKQLADNGLYKIWPQKALEPGEYAVVEFTPGKMNMQIWDFAWKSGAASGKK